MVVLFVAPFAGTDVSIRPHTSAQHTSAYVSIRQHPSAYVSIRQHTPAYVSIRQHTSAYVRIRHSIRQHTPAYVSIRQHTSAYVFFVAPFARTLVEARETVNTCFFF